MDKLNGKFESESEYFHQAVDFLEQYKWIFHSANTHILVDQVPECVPKQWDEFVNFANWKRVEIATKGFDQVNLNVSPDVPVETCILVWVLAF